MAHKPNTKVRESIRPMAMRPDTPDLTMEELDIYLREKQNERFCGRVELDLQYWNGSIQATYLRETKLFKKINLKS